MKFGACSNRRDRHGKINVTGYFDPAVRRSIRMIQAHHPTLTQHDILAEALDLLFARYGVPQTAQTLPCCGRCRCHCDCRPCPHF